jgi:hypothetical protein
MGKKWKRLLVQRRANGRVDMPTVRPEPVVSNSEMIERMEAAAAPAREPEPEVVEEAPVVEPEAVVEETPVVEEEPVVEAPPPKRRRSTRRGKTTSES